MSGVNAQQINDHFQRNLEIHREPSKFLELVENEILKLPMYQQNLSNDNLVVLATYNLNPQQLNKLIKFTNFSRTNKKFYKNILTRNPLPSFDALDQSIQFGLIDNADDTGLKKILESMLEVKADVIDRILAKISNDTVVNLIFEKLKNNPVADLTNNSFRKLIEIAKNDKEKLLQIYRLQANNKILSSLEKVNIVNDIFGKLVDNRATTTEELLSIFRALMEPNVHLAQNQKENIVKKLVKRIDIDKTTVPDRISIAKYTKDSDTLIKLADKLDNSSNQHNIELAKAIITNTTPLNKKVAEKILNKPEVVYALKKDELEKLAEVAHTAAEFIHILNASKVTPTVIDKIINRTPDKQATGLSSLRDRNPKVCSIEDIAKIIIELHKNSANPFQLNQLSANNINRLMGVKSLRGDEEAQKLLREEFNKKASPQPAKPKVPVHPDPAGPEKPVAPPPTTKDGKKAPAAATPKTPKDLKTEWIKEQGYQKEVKAQEDGFDFLETTDLEKRATVFIACLEKIAKDSSQRDEDGNLTIYADDFDKKTAQAILARLLENGPSIPGVQLKFNNIPSEDNLASMVKEYNDQNQVSAKAAGRLHELLEIDASETASSFGSVSSDTGSEHSEEGPRHYREYATDSQEKCYVQVGHEDEPLFFFESHDFPCIPEGDRPTHSNIKIEQIEGCFIYLNNWNEKYGSGGNSTVSLDMLQSNCGAAMADEVKKFAKELKASGLLRRDFLKDDRSPAPAGLDRLGSGSARRPSSHDH